MSLIKIWTNESWIIDDYKKCVANEHLKYSFATQYIVEEGVWMKITKSIKIAGLDKFFDLLLRVKEAYGYSN